MKVMTRNGPVDTAARVTELPPVDTKEDLIAEVMAAVKEGDTVTIEVRVVADSKRRQRTWVYKEAEFTPDRMDEVIRKVKETT